MYTIQKSKAESEEQYYNSQESQIIGDFDNIHYFDLAKKKSNQKYDK